MRLLPFALRELGRHRRFTLLFLSVLGLGLTGFLLVESLRSSVGRSLDDNSRTLLSADLAVSLRRPFTAAEEEKLLTILAGRKASKSVELSSMLGGTGEARLALVKAVDAAYPLVGRLNTTDGRRAAPLLTGQGLLYTREALEQAGSAETPRLGGVAFEARGTVTDDSTQSFRGAVLGGRVFISLEDLDRSGLVQPGTTGSWIWYVLTNSEAEAEKLGKEISLAFPGPEWRVTTARESGESSFRPLSYLGDFLGLVALVALLLAALGASYLYRHYLEKRRQEIALYRAVGVPLLTIQLQVLLHTMLLALASLLPAFAAAAALLPVLERAILLWSRAPLELRLGPGSVLPLLALCLFGTPCLLLPELLVLREFSPLALFRDQGEGSAKRPIWHHLPALLLFAALAPLVARSFRTAGIFLGVLAALVVALALAWLLFARLLKTSRGCWTTRHAFLLLTRRRRSAATVFLTLSLGSLLLHLMPQLESCLRAELETPTRLPSLFLFDIQQEQKKPLEAALQQAGLTLEAISPLVRARILSVNKKGFERTTEASSFRTREEEQDAQFRNRGVNLSFRASLQESETIVSGRPFAPQWDEKSGALPELSVETRYAERLGLRVGDVLKFDVQGNEIEAQIVNERRIRWTSFQPNFFLVFQDGVLNDSPMSYLANLPALSGAAKRDARALVARSFPNVSVIDVAATVERMLELLAKMRLSLALLAALALSSGLAVLGSVLGLEARDRARFLVLFRALGASEQELRRILLTESLALAVLAVGLGAAGAVAFAGLLARFLFDGAFAIAAWPLVLFSGALLLVALATSWLATRSLVARSPLEALRSPEY